MAQEEYKGLLELQIELPVGYNVDDYDIDESMPIKIGDESITLQIKLWKKHEEQETEWEEI